MLKLDKGLQEFLKEAIEEKSICTVEGSFRRQLTLKEEKHLNAALHPFGHAVHCFKCDACFRNSGGTQPYHIERIPLKEDSVHGQTD